MNIWRNQVIAVGMLKNSRKIMAFGLLATLLWQAGCASAIPITGSRAANTQAVKANTPVPFPTSTTAPTETPTQPATSVPTLNPTLSVCLPNQFVSDVTVPYGSTFSPGTAFTKTWRLMNTGTCTWTTGYTLVFNSGTQMGGPVKVALPKIVKPGESIDLSVELVAPPDAGTYQASWVLHNADGLNVNQGANAISPLSVFIQVSGAASSVFDTNVSANPPVYVGGCPVNVTFTATIYTNGPSLVRYYWSRSDGSRGGESTINLANAGFQTVSEVLSIGAGSNTFSGWDQINIEQTTQSLSAKATYNLECLNPGKSRSGNFRPPRH